jgi:hypothetical protein
VCCSNNGTQNDIKDPQILSNHDIFSRTILSSSTKQLSSTYLLLPPLPLCCRLGPLAFEFLVRSFEMMGLSRQ